MSSHPGVWLTGVTLCAAATLSAQAAAQELTRTECPPGAVVVGELGYSRMECNCTYFSRDRRWEFRSEPTIAGIKPGGPAEGKLQDGDVVTAIDGFLITTYEGGRRFSQPVPGKPVTVTVRRGGRVLDVAITPEAACAPGAPVPTPAPKPPPQPRPPEGGVLPAPPAAPRPAARPAPPTPAPPPPRSLSPRARLGLSIECSQCAIAVTREGGDLRWRLSESPVVLSVEPGGDAHRAGLRAGDVLTHIDGKALTSDEGGAAFGSIQPGDTVTFRYSRNNVEHTARVVARGYREPPPTPVPPPAPDSPEITRFSGVLGDTFIQVTGGPITVRRTETEVIIRSSDITVRVSRTGGS